MHGASERAFSMPTWERRARTSTASSSSSPAPYPLSSLIAGPSRQQSAPAVSPKTGPRFRTIIHPEHRVDRELRRKLKASKARLISRFDEIADKYGSVAPEDDDELDIIEGKVVHDRGALRALQIREFAEGTDYLAEALEYDDNGLRRRQSEPPIGPDKILFGNEEDELGDWGERSGLDAQFPPREIEQDWTEEDALDMRNFLLAEAARRERSGEEQLEAFTMPQVPQSSSPSRRLSYLQLDDDDDDEVEEDEAEYYDEEEDEGIPLSTLDMDRELPPAPQTVRHLPPSSPPLSLLNTPSSPGPSRARGSLSLSRSLPNLHSSLKQPTRRHGFPGDSSQSDLRRSSSSRSVRFSAHLSYISGLPAEAELDQPERLWSQTPPVSSQAGPSNPTRRASSHLPTPAPESSRHAVSSSSRMPPPRQSGGVTQSPTRRWWAAPPGPQRENASVPRPAVRAAPTNLSHVSPQPLSSPLKGRDKGKGRAVPLEREVRRDPPFFPSSVNDFPEPSTAVPNHDAEEPEEQRCQTCLGAGGSRAAYARVCRGAGNPRLCPHLPPAEVPAAATSRRNSLPPRAPSERLRSQSATPMYRPTPRGGSRQPSVTPSTASKYTPSALPGYTPEIRWANGGMTKCKRCLMLGGERARFAIYCRGRNRPRLCADLANIPVLDAPPDSPILASERATSMMPSPTPARAPPTPNHLPSPEPVRAAPFPVVPPPSFRPALPRPPPPEITDDDSDVQYLGSTHGDDDESVDTNEANVEVPKAAAVPGAVINDNYDDDEYTADDYGEDENAEDVYKEDAGDGYGQDNYSEDDDVDDDYAENGLDDESEATESPSTSSLVDPPVAVAQDDTRTGGDYAEDSVDASPDYEATLPPEVPDDSSLSDSASYQPDDAFEDEDSVDDSEEYHDARQLGDHPEDADSEHEASLLDADASTDSDSSSDLSGSVYDPELEEAQLSGEHTESEATDSESDGTDDEWAPARAKRAKAKNRSDHDRSRPSWVRVEPRDRKDPSDDDQQLIVDEDDGSGANYSLPPRGNPRYETTLRFTGASPNMEYLQCADCVAAGGQRRERAMWCRGRGEVACPFTSPPRVMASNPASARATPHKRPVTTDDLFSPQPRSATPDESDDFFTPPLGHRELPDDDGMDLDSSVAADEPMDVSSSSPVLAAPATTTHKPASVASSDWSPNSSLHSKGSRLEPLPRAATVLPTPPRSESISVSAEPTPMRAPASRPRAATVVATVSRPTPPPSHTPEPQRVAKAQAKRTALNVVQEQREPTPADTDTLAADTLSPRLSMNELAVRARDIGMSLDPSPSGRLSSTLLNSLNGVYKQPPGYSLSSSVSSNVYALPSPPSSVRSTQGQAQPRTHQSTAGLMLPPPVPARTTPRASSHAPAPASSPQTTPRKRARRSSQEYDDYDPAPDAASSPPPRYRSDSAVPLGGRGRTQSMSARPSTPAYRATPSPAPSSTPRKKSRFEREIERAASLVTDDDGLEWGLDEDAGYEVARLWREGSVSVPARPSGHGSVAA